MRVAEERVVESWGGPSSVLTVVDTVASDTGVAR
jgi:hypothetical protein